MPLGQSNTTSIPCSWFRLDTPNDFMDCAALLIPLGYHGIIEFGKDLQGNPSCTLQAKNTTTNPAGDGVNAVSATFGQVLRWDGTALKQYPDWDAYLAENTVT